jgi:hypothetical protein
MRVHWPLTQHRAWSGPHRKHLFWYQNCCVTLRRVVAWSTENTAAIVACSLERVLSVCLAMGHNNFKSRLKEMCREALKGVELAQNRGE